MKRKYQLILVLELIMAARLSFSQAGMGIGTLDPSAMLLIYPSPDLQDLFIAGARRAYGVGHRDGENCHTLTESKMPSHMHKISGTINGSLDGGGTTAVATTTGYENGGTTGETGGNVAHENSPPYTLLHTS